jgi:hypothetical protein
MRNLTSIPGRPNMQVCLQREGVPEECDCHRFDAHGAVFEFPGRVELMSDLLIAIEWRGVGCRCRKIVIEGIVIGCRQTGAASFETTVLFLPSVDTLCVEGRHSSHMAN